MSGKCDLLDGCIFFNDKMSEFTVAADMMKKELCLGDHTACARYMVFRAKGRENVPRDLFPNQLKKARLILAEG